MIVPGDQAHRFVVHDRDTIYAEGVDRTLEAMGLAVLKTPARVPQAKPRSSNSENAPNRAGTILAMSSSKTRKGAASESDRVTPRFR
jgi:hypothetical protein